MFGFLRKMRTRERCAQYKVQTHGHIISFYDQVNDDVSSAICTPDRVELLI